MTIPESPPELEALLDYLKRTRGFDFTAYKRASLLRRVQKRMQTVAVREFADYIDYLEVHPEEFPHLFNTILINITGFFRDPLAWDYLGAEIMPRILGENRSDDPIRVWSAGCASGEEAYSIAVLLAEHLGAERFRKRVKIYATDVDEDALTHARLAAYAPTDVEEVPPRLLEKYFERTSSNYVFHRELRRSVIFGRHDLVQDAPISRIDLLVCRNTLMYFNSETQARVLARFHFALNEGGYLFLGKAEMLLTHGHLFAPLDLKRRVFVKVPEPDARARPPRMAAAYREEAGNNPMVKETGLRELAFEVDPVAQMVVDGSGIVTMINERARALFGLGSDDVGRQFRDLTLSHRPTDLRTAIEQASVERRPSLRRDVAWATPSGETRYLDVHVQPFFDAAAGFIGAKVTFTDVTRVKQLQDELQQSKQALETAYEELQSSNEELETTNEELQSTNEELETMNEELQSTNEELETINTELRQRTEELNEANSFLGSILSGLRAGVAVVDRELKVLVWNDRATDLWGLRADEVQGRHLLNLDIGLPVSELRQPIRACLSGESRYQQLSLDATNRRGRPIRCTVTCSPLDASGAGAARGAIVLMETNEEGAPA
ncbi:MAG TPA: CheR family methyltransferase [Methylomirabilota bacterium]|jgi:two-component system CheB/CheR fusion protein|nr:CheR family methyltransferase [Methylomirabilota bacterium]